jgi:phenylpropionate dioxygenase-like ring-hydroxylating dioxygenase large terminal subunit
MDRHEDVALVRRFFALHERRADELAPAVYRQPAADYTSPAHLERERAALFGGTPLLAGLSADIPDAGDYLTLSGSGAPVVVVRGEDGVARAMVNTCRHRGARLVEGRGRAHRCLVCPYHAWTYDLTGRLTAQPGAGDGFSGLDRADLGLRPLPVAEGHGLIFVRPPAPPTAEGAKNGEPIDLDAVLCGLGPELDGYKLASYHHVETRTHVQPCNWKLVVDTFLEAYHIFSLHKQSIAPQYFSTGALFDAYGPHSRFIGVRRSILELLGAPEDSWSIFPHATIHYVLAPNALLVHQLDHFELWRVFPLDVDRSLVHTGLYAATPPDDERAQRHWRKNLDILLRVTTEEDFPQCQRIQADLAAGATDEVIFGRNEPALAHFHRSLAAMLVPA